MSDPVYMESRDQKEILSQASEWERYFARHGNGIAIVKTPKLRQLLRSGIPDHLRGICGHM